MAGVRIDKIRFGTGGVLAAALHVLEYAGEYTGGHQIERVRPCEVNIGGILVDRGHTFGVVDTALLGDYENLVDFEVLEISLVGCFRFLGDLVRKLMLI